MSLEKLRLPTLHILFPCLHYIYAADREKINLTIFVESLKPMQVVLHDSQEKHSAFLPSAAHYVKA